MSKKNLLSESTIRQFMKYADIGGLTDNFINENYMDEDEDEGLDLGPEAEAAEASLPPSPETAGDEDLEALGGEEGAEEITDTSEASIETLVDALADTITQVTGVEVTAAGEGEEGLEDLEAMGDEEPAAELPGDEGPADMAAAGEDEEEPVLEDIDVIDEDGIVNETLRRVSRRLKGMKTRSARNAKREALVEDIASRIAKRLKRK